MDKVVGTDIIRDLSRQIGPDWKELGTVFGMTKEDLHYIQANSMPEVSYQMLLLWMKKNGSNATCRRLSETLMKVGRTDLCNVIKTGLSQPSTSETTLQSGSEKAKASLKGTVLTPEMMRRRRELELRAAELRAALPPPLLRELRELRELLPREQLVTDAQRSQTTCDDSKSESGSEGYSSTSTDQETKSEIRSEEVQRQLKDRLVAVNKEKQLLTKLQTTTEELEETKSSLRAAEEKLAISQQQYSKELTALQVDLEKTIEALNIKQNELEETKSSLRAAEEQLATFQQQYFKELPTLHVNLEKTRETLNSKASKLSGSADQHQPFSEQVENTPKFEGLLDHFSVPNNLHIRQTVDANGRLLTIPNTDISLDIPEGALKEKCTIDFRAIHDSSQDSEAESFTTNSCVIVELLPNYLQLSVPAKLTVPHCLIVRKGEETTAKVFESHSLQDGKPVWKENCSIRNEVGESSCHLWITQFCWIKIHICGKTVKAKRIYIFAAKSDKSTREITNMEVGYYVNLPTAGKIIADNNLQVLQKKEFVFEKEGNKPLRLSFVRILPASYWCYSTPEENPQEISFRSIALSQESSRPFPLIAKAGQKWVDSFCYFMAEHGQEQIKLACPLADTNREQPLMSTQTSTESEVLENTEDQSSSSSESSAMDKTVSMKDMEALSKEIGSFWKKIARALGLTEPFIENIEEKYPQQEEVSYQMLLEWTRTKGTSATNSVLVMALEKAGRKDLADTFKETGTWKKEESLWLSSGKRPNLIHPKP